LYVAVPSDDKSTRRASGSRRGPGHGRCWRDDGFREHRGTPASRLMLAYDDVYSIQYMKQNLQPY
jgi:hypothetical protein